MTSRPAAALVPWPETGVEEVAPGVHRISLPLPNDSLRAVNVYAIRDGDGLVLIDGGWALDEATRALEAAVGELGHDLSAIKRFLVTHVHRDHMTLALRVRRLFGAKVEIGIGERESVNALTSGDRFGAMSGLRRWGAGSLWEALTSAAAEPREQEPYAQPDGWIRDRQEIRLEGRKLLAIATPGHTRGHTVFVDSAAGLLFSGDHILPRLTPSIGFEPVRARSPLGDFLDSLHVILGQPDLRLLPAHGQVRASAHARARELVEHHEDRLLATLRIIGGRRLSAFDVARELPWTKQSRALGDLEITHQALAVGETAAHLDVLVDRGELRVVVSGGEVEAYERCSAAPAPCR